MRAQAFISAWSIRSRSVIQLGLPHWGLVVQNTRPFSGAEKEKWASKKPSDGLLPRHVSFTTTFCYCIPVRLLNLLLADCPQTDVPSCFCVQIFTFRKANFNSNVNGSQAALLSIPASFLSLSLSLWVCFNTSPTHLRENCSVNLFRQQFPACCSLPLLNLQLSLQPGPDR